MNTSRSTYLWIAVVVFVAIVSFFVGLGMAVAPRSVLIRQSNGSNASAPVTIAAGSVVSVGTSTITVQGFDRTTKTISFTPQTMVRVEEIIVHQPSYIKPGDVVSVQGTAASATSTGVASSISVAPRAASSSAPSVAPAH